MHLHVLPCYRLHVRLTTPPSLHPIHRLTTLLLHSNQLNTLPYQLQELKSLTTLVLAFNRFFELPPIVMELPSLAILVASGNYIRLVVVQ